MYNLYALVHFIGISLLIDDISIFSTSIIVLVYMLIGMELESICIVVFTFVFSTEIKHDFPFINICKVPREVLKTEGEARGFQPSRGTLRMLMNDKIMFDRYYCISSAK